MNGGASKRRLRVRRKRKGSEAAADIVDGVGVQVVAETGCCLVEAVTAATVAIALVTVPAFFISM